MNQNLKLIPIFTLLLLSLPSIALTQSTIKCNIKAGFWSKTEKSFTLNAALCSDTELCPDFYNLNWEKNKIASARRFATMQSCKMTYIGHDKNTAIYHSNNKLYLLNAENLKIIATFDFPQPTFAKQKDNFWALLATNELIVLNPSKNQNEPTLRITLKDFEPIDLVWQSERLVAISKNQLLWFPFVDAKLLPQQSIEIKPSLTENDYALDTHGLLVAPVNAGSTTYYRFENATRSTTRLNATASVRQIGGSQNYAMALTTDSHVTRIMARMLQSMQHRFEAKYWKLTPEDTKENTRRLFLAYDNTLVIDAGYTTKKALTVDTTDITWKRMALLEYTDPGNLAHIQSNLLFTVHPNAKNAIIAWHPRTGDKIGTIPNEELQKKGLSQPIAIRPISDKLPQLLVIDENNDFAILFPQTLKITQAFKDPDNHRKNALTFVDKTIIVPDTPDHKMRINQWTLIAENTETTTVSAQSLFDSTQVTDALNPYERWYGYTLNNGQSLANIYELQKPETTSEPLSELENQTNTHQPTTLAYIIAIFSILAVILTTAWRLGIGKKGHIHIQNDNENNLLEDSSVTLQLLDKLGRRYVTERDKAGFINLHFWNHLSFRILIPIIIAAIIGISTTAKFFYDDTFNIIAQWTLIIAIPCASLLWVLLSWNVWNRNYLLHFGSATQAHWFESGTQNQSIVYDTPQQRYKLKRGQWSQADLIPIILYDPKKPDFAIQYTGECGFPILPRKNSQNTDKPATTTQRLKQIPTYALFLAATILTFYLFKSAFPMPLSTWQLNNIEEKADKNNNIFIASCLESCSENDSTCHDQCNQRQLRRIFKSAGYEINTDPQTTPEALFNTQQSNAQQIQNILQNADKQPCSKIAKQINQFPLWQKNFEEQLLKIYNNAQPYVSQELRDAITKIKDTELYFDELCNNSNKCLQSTNACQQPPTCTGDNEELKNNLCTYAAAISQLTKAFMQ